jgi:hypothetical protein
VLEALDQFKGLMATTSALGCWSLGARERRLPNCHQRRQASSGMGAATAAHRRLAMAAVVVVRWPKYLDVIYNIFRVLCTFCELMK